MKIITNNQPRPLLSWRDLSDKEKVEFDWLETEVDQYSADFFRYKGRVYCLDEFIYTESIPGWDGIHPTSASSGVIIKVIHGLDETAIVGHCYC